MNRPICSYFCRLWSYLVPLLLMLLFLNKLIRFSNSPLTYVAWNSSAVNLLPLDPGPLRSRVGDQSFPGTHPEDNLSSLGICCSVGCFRACSPIPQVPSLSLQSQEMTRQYLPWAEHLYLSLLIDTFLLVSVYFLYYTVVPNLAPNLPENPPLL